MGDQTTTPLVERLRVQAACHRENAMGLASAALLEEAANEIERVTGAALDAYVSIGRAPELNLSNYDEDDVAGVNAAMIETWSILDNAFGPREEG